MMNCETIRELLLTDYLDNELPAQEKALVDAHLLSCLNCQRANKHIQISLVVPFQNLAPVLPRRDLWPQLEKNILAHLAAEKAKTAAPSPVTAPVISKARPSLQWKLASAAFFAAVLVVSLYLWNFQILRPQDSSRVTTVEAPILKTDFQWFNPEHRNLETMFQQTTDYETAMEKWFL